MQHPSEHTSNPIVVPIDKELEDLIPDYLNNRKNDVAKLRSLLPSGEVKVAEANRETFARLLHTMKGSGGSYGFHEITRICRVMETALQADSVPGLQIGLAGLEDFLARVQVEYVEEA